MGDATVNGDMPQSLFLSHLQSYPVVSDSISKFLSYHYGAKSVDITNATYAKFVKPIFPYLQTPAAYLTPYVKKADEFGDAALKKVDEKAPIVKSETDELKGTVVTYIHWPLEQANKGKDYTYTTYSTEYKKCGGNGYVAGGKAMVTTSLVISSDVLTWLSSFLQAKKEEAKEIAAKKTEQ